MLYTATLLLHIIAACATIGTVGFALYALHYGKATSYRPVALLLGGIATFEVFSGTLLAALSPELSASALTTHIVAYLGLCAAIEALLFMRMQKIALAYPTRLVTSPVVASCLTFTAAVSYGL